MNSQYSRMVDWDKFDEEINHHITIKTNFYGSIKICFNCNTKNSRCMKYYRSMGEYYE